MIESSRYEIQRQLSGAKLAETEKSLKYSEIVPASQKHLIESLFTLPRSIFKEEIAKWMETINVITNYSLFKEGDIYRLPRDKYSPKDDVIVEPAHKDGSIQDTKMIETNSLTDD
jgi:Protein of unknown function (DUF3435).